jgi:hypothetical protein
MVIEFSKVLIARGSLAATNCLECVSSLICLCIGTAVESNDGKLTEIEKTSFALGPFLMSSTGQKARSGDWLSADAKGSKAVARQRIGLLGDALQRFSSC